MSLSLESLQAAEREQERAASRLRATAEPWEQRVRARGYPYARFVKTLPLKRYEWGREGVRLRFSVGYGSEATFAPCDLEDAPEPKEVVISSAALAKLKGERDREANERDREVKGWRKAYYALSKQVESL